MPRVRVSLIVPVDSFVFFTVVMLLAGFNLGVVLCRLVHG